MNDKERKLRGQQETGDQEPVFSKKDQEKERAKQATDSIIKGAGKKYLESQGLPPGVSDAVINTAAKHPMVKHKLNKLENKVANNPLLRKNLSNAQPKIDAAEKALSSTRKDSPGNLSGPKMNGGGNKEAAKNDLTSKIGENLSDSGKNSVSDDSNLNKDKKNNVSPSLLEEPLDFIKKIKNIKAIAGTITAILPILLKIFVVLIVFMLMVSSAMHIFQNIEGVMTTVEKTINFFAGMGFDTAENNFFARLEKDYERYEKFNKKDEEFDIALIAATIHYQKVIDPREVDEENEEEYDEKNNNFFIHKNQKRNFYIQAYDKLGYAYSAKLGTSKLLGNLVDTRISATCIDLPETSVEGNWWDKVKAKASGYWKTGENVAHEVKLTGEDFLTVLGYILEDTFNATLQDINPFYLINLLLYNDSGEGTIVNNLNNYFEERFKDIGYDLTKNNIGQKIYDMFVTNSNFKDTNCGENQFKIPIIEKFMNREKYKDYLRKVYLPRHHANCNKVGEDKYSCEENQESIINKMIDEIFRQRDLYYYLIEQVRSSIYGTIPPYIVNQLEEPIKGWYRMGSCFGWRVIDGIGGQHKGIDISQREVIEGERFIYAVAAGSVDEAINTNNFNCGVRCFDNDGKAIRCPCPDARGNYVKIIHTFDSNQYITEYFHLKSVYVQKGDVIEKGQIIGLMGNTGRSTGPHLHFGMYDYSSGKYLNPGNLFNNPVEVGGNCLSPSSR